MFLVGRLRVSMEQTPQLYGLGNDPFDQGLEALTIDHARRLLRPLSKLGAAVTHVASEAPNFVTDHS